MLPRWLAGWIGCLDGACPPFDFALLPRWLAGWMVASMVLDRWARWLVGWLPDLLCVVSWRMLAFSVWLAPGQAHWQDLRCRTERPWRSELFHQFPTRPCYGITCWSTSLASVILYFLEAPSHDVLLHCALYAIVIASAVAALMFFLVVCPCAVMVMPGTPQTVSHASAFQLILDSSGLSNQGPMEVRILNALSAFCVERALDLECPTAAPR